jgi:hypothetical protein
VGTHVGFAARILRAEIRACAGYARLYGWLGTRCVATSRETIEIEIVHNMCRQIGPTDISRATLLCLSGLISKLGTGLFDEVHLSTHLASLCVDVPRELKTVSNRSNCHSPPA